MNEHRVSVALHGRFLFRTEWDDDKQRVIEMVQHLVSRGFDNASFTMTVRSRDKMMQVYQVQDFL